MAWRISFAATAFKELSKLDKKAQKDIRNFLHERIIVRQAPREYGRPLQGNLSGLWKYRVGNYRIIADIRDDEVLVIVVRVGHRKNVYGDH